MRVDARVCSQHERNAFENIHLAAFLAREARSAGSTASGARRAKEALSLLDAGAVDRPAVRRRMFPALRRQEPGWPPLPTDHRLMQEFDYEPPDDEELHGGCRALDDTGDDGGSRCAPGTVSGVLASPDVDRRALEPRHERNDGMGARSSTSIDHGWHALPRTARWKLPRKPFSLAGGKS